MSVPLLRVTPSEEGGMRGCAVWSYQAEFIRGIELWSYDRHTLHPLTRPATIIKIGGEGECRSHAACFSSGKTISRAKPRCSIFQQADAAQTPQFLLRPG